MAEKYKQRIPIWAESTPWKGMTALQLRRAALKKLKDFKEDKIVNKDLGITIEFSNTNARKASFGGAMYLKKMVAINDLPLLLRVAEYSNFGERKETDNPEVIGFLNFKAKMVIEGKNEYVRIDVQFCRGGKFFYNAEINKIELLPKKPRR